MVTVGIVFFNCHNYLASAIESVFNQTYTKWKLILIDDGSTDSSLEVASSFLYDERVELIADGLNLGLAMRLNSLILNCNTRYFCRMDADDIMISHRLKTQVEILERFDQIDVLGSNAFIIDESDCLKGLRNSYKSSVISTSSTLIHPTVMARAEWYKKNLYDVDFINRGQDMELWYRVRKRTPLYYVSEPLLFYREVAMDYARKYRLGLYEQFLLVKKYKWNLDVYFMLCRYFVIMLLFHTRARIYLLRRRNEITYATSVSLQDYKRAI